MNKEGYIKILKYGRNTSSGRRRFLDIWIDKKTNVINKNERVSCCYALFYKGLKDSVLEMTGHLSSDEHIMKLVAKHGFKSGYLDKEVRYYTGKILEGERNDENSPF